MMARIFGQNLFADLKIASVARILEEVLDIIQEIRAEIRQKMLGGVDERRHEVHMIAM